MTPVPGVQELKRTTHKAAYVLVLALVMAASIAITAFASPGGIATIAGTGVSGYSGDAGSATAAKLNAPRGAIANAGGGYLIADTANNRIRKIDGSGTITTVAGTGAAGSTGDGGAATAAKLSAPGAVTLDPAGGYLIADTANNKIRKVDGSGTITKVAGTGVAGFSGDGAAAGSAKLSGPGGMTSLSGGGYLIADTTNHRIRKVTAAGTISTVAGNGTKCSLSTAACGDGGTATAAQLGDGVTDVQPFSDGSYLIADTGDNRIRKVSTGGTISTVAGTGAVGFSGDGGPATAAKLSGPSAALPTADGGFLVTDTVNQRIRKVDPSGTITTVAGTGTAGYSGDGGPAASATLRTPFRLGLLSDGSLLVADRDNHAIRRIDAPPAPSISSTQPASPSNSLTPNVLGTASPNSTVSLFKNSSCAPPNAATGSASTFASPGIQASVTADSTTTFYGMATLAGLPSPCSPGRTYIADNTAPSAQVDSGPTGTTSDPRPTFTFSSSDQNATFTCSIDTGTAAFGSCSGPGNSHRPATGLNDGAYTFRAKATDSAGNSTTATRSFTVAAQALPTTITQDMTLIAGAAYTGGAVTIASGATVTAQPGALVKVTSLTVNGVLDVNGTAAQPVSFTSSQDSAAGQWSGITLNTGASSIDYAVVRYATTAITVSGSVSPSVTHSTIRDNSSRGISLTGGASPTITDDTVIRSHTGVLAASGGAPEIAANSISDCTGDPGISYNDNTANTTGQIRIHDNLVERCGASPSQFFPSPSTNAAISVYGGSSNVSLSGVTLSGNTVRDGGWAIDYYVNSSNSTIPSDLDENTLSGNVSNAIWVAGKVAASTTWENRGFAIVPEGGYNLSVASGATLTLGPGLVLKPYQSNATINVEGNLIAAGTAAQPVTITSIKDDSVGGDTNGDGGATSPAAGDFIGLQFASGNATTAPGRGTLDYVHVSYGGSLNVSGMLSFGAALSGGPTSAPSTIRHSRLSHSTFPAIHGNGSVGAITDNTFLSNGTAVALTGGGTFPVTGNTLDNNASGISIAGSGNPEIANNTIEDCSSYGIYRSININGTGEVRIHDNTIDRCGASPSQPPLPSSYAAISVYGGSSNVTLSGVTLGGNTIRGGGRAVDYYVNPNSTIPSDIDENSLSGNTSNAIWLSGKVAASTTWENHGFAMVPQGGYNLKVASGATLALGPGLVVKPYQFNATINVEGNLIAEGTAAQPITITSIKDDSVGGDTNGDGGASAPAASDWDGIRTGYSSGTIVGRATFDHANIAYGGYNYMGMVRAECPCDGSRILTVTHSTLRNSTYAVYLPGNASNGDVQLAWNDFHDNPNAAIYKGGTALLQAPNNGFGCESGPAPRGCGDWITPNVVPNPIKAEAGSSCMGESSDCGEGADPVVLATGALIYAQTDLRLTNKGDPLELRRAYNSNDKSDSGFGKGWSHTALAMASEQESGDVFIRRTDGRRDLFSKVGAVYSPPPGVHDILTKQGDGTFRLTSRDQTVTSFDATGRVSQMADDHGLITAVGYDSNKRLATITDASSQTFTFTYNASNHITKVTDSTGRHTDYTYNATGELATATDALTKTTTYHYDDARNRSWLTSITDPRNNTYLTNVYDNSGRITRQTDGLGNVWTIAYSAGQTQVTAPNQQPNGPGATYAFDNQNRLTALTDPLARTTTYSYDAYGNVDQIARPGGADSLYAHDSSGNLTGFTDPLDHTTTLQYNAQNHLTSATNPRNKTWTYAWGGPSGTDLTKVTDPKNQETNITYDSAGHPLTVADPKNHTTALTYDSRGNPISVTDPLNHATTYGYDSRSYLTTVTRPGLPAQSYGRSAMGDLTSLTTPEGNTYAYGRDANGFLSSVTDPALNVWSIERNAMERPTTITDPLSNQTTMAYDDNLTLTGVTDRRDETTSYDYDAANQLTGIDRPDGGEWAFGYDSRGNRNEMVDARNDTTSYAYDLADRMVEVDEPLGATSEYGYDPANNLTSVTDPRGKMTSFDYDDINQLTAIHQPLGKDTSFSYDAARNLTGRTTALGTVTATYDNADRLTGLLDGTDVLRAFGYDDAGRLTAATDAQAKTLSFTYDDDDRLTALSDGRGQSGARSYDTRGNLVSQTDGRGTIGLGYDALNRPTSLTDPQNQVQGFDYDSEGNLTQVDLANGATTTNGFDPSGRLTETTTANGLTQLEHLSYAYDAAGNRTSQTDRNGAETTYDHDSLNRLTSVDPPAEAPTAYAYDVAGNRTAAGGTTYSYNDLNRLTSSSDGTAYSYDGAGRLTTKTKGQETTTYSWGPLDELASVDDGQSPVAFSYDGLGRRSERIDASGTQTAHYGDLGDRATLDTNASGIVRSYIQGPSPTAGLLEEREGGTTSYPVADGRGDVTTRLDESGAIGSRQTYDPWGTQTSGPGQEMGFLGAYQRRSDPATGLNQMGIRQYDASVGQFQSEDPILGNYGFGQSLNRYAYAWDSPLTILDLNGMSIGGDIGGAVSDLGGAAGDAGTWVGGAVSDSMGSAMGVGGDALRWGARAACNANRYGAFGPLTPVTSLACPEGREMIADSANWAADRGHDAYKFAGKVLHSLPCRTIGLALGGSAATVGFAGLPAVLLGPEVYGPLFLASGGLDLAAVGFDMLHEGGVC